MKSFKQHIEEALSISKYRELKQRIGDGYKQRYKDWFGGKYRVYIDPANKSTVSAPEKDIPVPPEVYDIVTKTGYKIDSYRSGIASNGKRLAKIGKIIQRAVSSNPSDEKASRALKMYNERLGGDTAKDNSKSLIVISRHPYDIAGQSTDRGWNSCKNLESGVNRHYIPVEIESGCLVAYQIKASDKNIENPQGRILIIPYVNIDDEKDTFLYAVERTYGSTSREFVSTVQDWLDSKQGEKKGLYCRSDKVYDDETPTLRVAGVDMKDIKKAAEYMVKYSLKTSLDLESLNRHFPELFDSLAKRGNYIVDVYKKQHISSFVELFCLGPFVGTHGRGSDGVFDNNLNLSDGIEFNIMDRAHDDIRQVLLDMVDVYGLSEEQRAKISELTDIDPSDFEFIDDDEEDDKYDERIENLKEKIVNELTGYYSGEISPSYSLESLSEDIEDVLDRNSNSVVFFNENGEMMRLWEAYWVLTGNPINGKNADFILFCVQDPQVFVDYVETNIEEGDVDEALVKHILYDPDSLDEDMRTLASEFIEGIGPSYYDIYNMIKEDLNE